MIWNREQNTCVFFSSCVHGGFASLLWLWRHCVILPRSSRVIYKQHVELQNDAAAESLGFFFFFGYYCLFVSNKGSYTILKLAADLRKLKRNKKLHTGNTSYCACIIINIIIVINFYYYYNDYF